MVQYYEPVGFAQEIFTKRHALHAKETWFEACDRASKHVAQAEKGEIQHYWQSEFYEILARNEFMPGGRIWYGSGRPKGQLLNCFVIPTEDSREGWGRTTSDTIIISSTGGGLGANYSPIRPRGSTINGSGGNATGAVSLMSIVNSVGEEVKAGGGRRVALMMALNLDHGDIEEFLDKKLDLGQLNNANVSVWFSENPELFFEKVRNDEMFELKFRGKVIRQISAKEIWTKIVSNALKSGEPGLLNGYLFNKMSNISYYKPIISTNPCGEIGLVEYDCCCLGALVLTRFVHDGKISWTRLKEVVNVAVRFLDNVLTVNTYPLPEIREMCSKIRRIGLGVMGLHDMLLLLGHKYNSPEGLETVDKVQSFIKNTAYEASIELAKEKGAFPKFEADKFLMGGFAKTLKPSIRHKIAEFGIRNCAILTMAPTGTTSMICGVTSGVEPMFAPAYRRRYRDGEELKEEIVIHPLLKEFVKQGKSIDHFQGTYDLSLRDHFEMQRTCQRHVDNAVSKTINVPQGMSVDELSELYMEYFPELKGVTVYPEGSRADQPLTPLSLAEALEYINSASEQATSIDSCRSGVCET